VKCMMDTKSRLAFAALFGLMLLGVLPVIVLSDLCPDNVHSCNSSLHQDCCCNTTTPAVCGCKKESWTCCGLIKEHNGNLRVYACPEAYPYCRTFPGISGWVCFSSVNGVRSGSSVKSSKPSHLQDMQEGGLLEAWQ